MLPAQISAMPAYMTVFVLPREESPAVRAKGTVRPSAKPRVRFERKAERDSLGWGEALVVVPVVEDGE